MRNTHVDTAFPPGHHSAPHIDVVVGFSPSTASAWTPMTARLPLERHRMLDLVMATLDALSPSKKRVGHLLIHNPRRFDAMSMSEIARECCVTKPTLVRFSKGLG